MPRKKMSKSDRVRAVFERKGLDTKVSEVVSILAAKRVPVSIALVNKVRERMRSNPSGERRKPGPKPGSKKGRGRKRGGRRPGAGRAAPAEVMVSLTTLTLARDLIDVAGSVDAAKQTLDLLAAWQA